MKNIIIVLAMLCSMSVFSQDKTKAFVYDWEHRVIGVIDDLKGNEDQRKEAVRKVIQQMDGDYYYVHYYTEKGVLTECPFYKDDKVNMV